MLHIDVGTRGHKLHAPHVATFCKAVPECMRPPYFVTYCLPGVPYSLMPLSDIGTAGNGIEYIVWCIQMLREFGHRNGNGRYTSGF